MKHLSKKCINLNLKYSQNCIRNFLKLFKDKINCYFNKIIKAEVCIKIKSNLSPMIKITKEIAVNQEAIKYDKF